MPTITADSGAGSTSPISILTPWAASWQSANVVHTLIGRDTAVSVTGARPRSGEFQALYDTEAEAFECVTLHRGATTFTLTDSGIPTVDMSYAIDGEVRLTLEADLRHWVVTIGYMRVEL
jgi:hypothetical protein